MDVLLGRSSGLRQRVPGYQAGELEQRFPELNAEEGYLFAYGFMTPEVWHDLHRRPRTEARGHCYTSVARLAAGRH